MNRSRLDAFSDSIGGSGCVINAGYLVYTWGDFTSRHNWASASKPCISTLLFAAIHEGKVSSPDSLIFPWWPALRPADQTMTFRHLADMTSGYAVAEDPGQAWAYNDYAIQLYVNTLDKVFNTNDHLVTAGNQRFKNPLQFQDGGLFESRKGRVRSSPRDFARMGWFWLNKGNWNGAQLLPRTLFDAYVKADTDSNLPTTVTPNTQADDYLGVGSYGGGVDQGSGQGIYGFNWWYNLNHDIPGLLTWPSAPADTYLALGRAGKDGMAIFPSLGLVVAAYNDKSPTWGDAISTHPPDPNSTLNRNLKLLVESLPARPVIPLSTLDQVGGRDIVFPAASWQSRGAAQMGMDPAALDQLEHRLGGRGCVIRGGYIVKTWGNQSQTSDLLSSAKPILSTLLFCAIEEGLVRSVDQPIIDFGWPLIEKDRPMTFRHLGAMVSGYARPEPPGQAWAYNDYAIQLYQKTLFDKVYKADPKSICEDPRRLGALHLEDGLRFTDNRRIIASVRDFARIAWFWMNQGRWGDRQILPRRYFVEYMKPQVRPDMPLSRKSRTHDYLKIGTYGGGSAHFTEFGPGIYGFNWWFNARGAAHPDRLTWPDAPPDTVMSIGAGGNCSAMMPGLQLLLVNLSGDWGAIAAGDPDSPMNQALKLLATSAGFHAPATGVAPSRASDPPPAR